tara:strand:- start:457 stop:843 length:387 start_codon:yes stop_codon:yes gene_type:complete
VRTYQTVIIIKPDLDETQVNEASEKISQFVTKFSGSVLKFEAWGKKRLAYRIRKSRYGFYLSFCHSLDPANVPSFEKELKLDEGILKHLVIRLEPPEVERILSEPQAPDEVESTNLNDKKEALLGEST